MTTASPIRLRPGPKRVCRCADPDRQKVRGLCMSCYHAAHNAGTLHEHDRKLHVSDEIGRAFDSYRASTSLTRREIAADLGVSLSALDAAVSRYRKHQRDEEAGQRSDAYDFVRSGLARGAAAPPLPTADELAAWHAAGCPLGSRLAAHRERAA